MSLIIPANSAAASGGYVVANSYRSGADDHYLVRNKTTATNVADLTISVWVKRSKIADKSCILASWGGDTSNTGSIFFTDGDKLTFEGQTGGSYSANGGVRKITTQVFRDVSAWSHLVFQKDDGVFKIYHNGTEITAFDTNTQSSGTNIFNNASGNVTVGNENLAASDHDFQGYIAEAVLIDGQALAPTSFGEFDEDSGIWKPIDVSGLTFGNNGFYLDFEDSSAMGNDASGGTDFTLQNISAIDQSTDTCTNNFATLNVLAGRNNPNAYYATFSEGNLKLVGNSSTNNGNAFSTMAFNTGKWYCEVKMVDADNSLFPCVGVIPEDLVASANSPSNSGQIGQVRSDTVAYSPDGETSIAGTEASYGDTFTNNDIIGIAIDCDNGAVYFSKNGTFQASGDPTSGASKTNAAMTFTPGKYYFFGGSVYKDTNDIEFNFGSPPFAISSGNTDGDGYGNFEYAVPSGYFSLNTKNLAEYG